MKELILLVAVAVLLFIPQLVLLKVQRPRLSYIRITSAVFLMILIWLFGGDSPVAVRVILTVVALTSSFKEVLYLRKVERIK